MMTYLFQEPVEQWPLCDCLIAFHSKGFPLKKTIEYAKLRKPFIVNNLQMQFGIQDRRHVYGLLQKAGIQIPRYAILDRDSDDPKRESGIFLVFLKKPDLFGFQATR